MGGETLHCKTHILQIQLICQKVKCSFTCCVFLEEFPNRHLGLNEKSDAVEKQEYIERGRRTVVSVKIGEKILTNEAFRRKGFASFLLCKVAMAEVTAGSAKHGLQCRKYISITCSQI